MVIRFGPRLRSRPLVRLKPDLTRERSSRWQQADAKASAESRRM